MKIKNNFHLENLRKPEKMLFPKDYVKEGWASFKNDTIKFYLLQEPFTKAFEAASNKLLTPEMLDSVEDGSFYFIWNNHFLIRTNGGKVTFFVIDPNENSMVFYFSNENGKEEPWSVDIGNNIKMSENMRAINSFKNTLVTLINFIRYAEIETKLVKENTKTNITRKEGKVVNQTGTDFLVLDSRWFTNIVREEGFKVSGHFRLQPYKDRKKLIYIKEFQKNGYNLCAKKTVE